MKPEFFSNHSKECIELNENLSYEFCICKKCFCHYCQFKNNKEYNQKYLQEYFKQKVFEVLK